MDWCKDAEGRTGQGPEAHDWSEVRAAGRWDLNLGARGGLDGWEEGPGTGTWVPWSCRGGCVLWTWTIVTGGRGEGVRTTRAQPPRVDCGQARWVQIPAWLCGQVCFLREGAGGY